jgi:hypothetical protein
MHTLKLKEASSLSESVQMYKNKVRFNRPRDVQKLLTRTANILVDDQISDAKARVIGYLCQIMFKGFETIDLQEQIDELQQFKESLIDTQRRYGD